MQKLVLIFINISFLLLANMASATELPWENRGAYVAHIGDCVSCHTNPGDKPFAGGLAINSPFGIIYASNITPDKQYGIGEYSLQDFTRAVREGTAKDGHHLYPAMPYPSFAGASDEDIKALYEYFMHNIKPVHKESPQTKLPFPFNQRWGISIWNYLFLDKNQFKPDQSHDEKWNRGAYLVETMGHCSACHTPRGLAFQEKGAPASSEYLTGETLDNWHAPNLRQAEITGLGKWTEEDISRFLKTGHSADIASFGNMTQVIENSLQYLTDDDRQAIAHYLSSLNSLETKPSYSLPVYENEHPGAGIYASSCASCHMPDGTGKPPLLPKLAGNPAAISKDPTSVIRIILEGDATAKTKYDFHSARMPAFGEKLTDKEIADVATFIRESWNNHAQRVTQRDVAILRKKLHKENSNQ